MNPNDVRGRLESAANTLGPAGDPPLATIRDRADRQRRRRQRGGIVLVCAAIGAIVAVPAIRESVRHDSSYEPPIAAGGECPLSAATSFDRTKLLLVRADCSVQQVPIEVGAAISYAALAPDRERVALTTVGTGQLLVADSATGASRVIAQAVDTIGDPVWSPDGATLAYWANNDGVPSLFVIPADGGEPTRVSAAMTPASHPAVNPAWNPDGSRLAYLQGATVVLADLQDGTLRPLSQSPSGVRQPFWGADGSTLYAIRTQGNDGHFAVVELDPTTGHLVSSSSSYEGVVEDAIARGATVTLAVLTDRGSTTTILNFTSSLDLVVPTSVTDEFVSTLTGP